MNAERSKLSNFIVLLSGQIDSAEFPTFSNFYCKYSYVYGADWEQIGGIHEGLSSHCERGSAGDSSITVGVPIEATFTSTNPFGWPQIVLTCYGSDFFGNDVIRGYGAVHIPTIPGRTTRRIAMFVPEASTSLQRFFGWITGKRAEFVDARIVATTEGRQVTRVRSQGIITITMDVVLKDMKKFGYDVLQSSVQSISECPLPDFTSTFDDRPEATETKDSEAKLRRAIAGFGSQPGPSNMQRTSSHAASPPQVRPLPMPRQLPEISTDSVEEIRKGSISNTDSQS